MMRGKELEPGTFNQSSQGATGKVKQMPRQIEMKPVLASPASLPA